MHWLVTKHGPRPQFIHPWLADIVNREGCTLGLDMDRCDYLMRDSFYSQGVVGMMHVEAPVFVQLLLDSCKVENLCSENIIAFEVHVQRVANFRAFMFSNLYLNEAVLLEGKRLMERVTKC